MVVVVRADDENRAFDNVVGSTNDDEVLFVSNPWPVEPLADADDDDGPEFGSLEAFDQHPER